jgi:CheY-like chemotaxis protein
MPAAALTAFTTPEDRTRAIGAGFQELLSKPVQPAALVATLATLCRQARATTET